jgi:hypothetical protein
MKNDRKAILPNNINEEAKTMYCKPFILPKHRTIFIIMSIAAFMLAAYVPAVSAEEKPDADSGWEFQVAPYMWFLAASGDVTVKGQKSDLDLEFSDIWDELNIAGMLAFEGRNGRWGFYGDLIGANLGKDTTVDGIKIDPTVNLVWLTAGGFYRLGTWDLSDAPANKVPTVTVDAFAGLRYTYLDMKLDFKGIGDVSGDQDWVDPVVGARAIFDLSEHWVLSFNGDVGGFGVGSDFAWDAVGLIGYRFGLFGKDNATAFGGYRARYQDYTDGSGDDKFEWDVTLHGPLLGLAIGF